MNPFAIGDLKQELTTSIKKQKRREGLKLAKKKVPSEMNHIPYAVIANGKRTICFNFWLKL